MKDTEFHNFFQVAESRNISTVEVAEMLILNGRQIYLLSLKNSWEQCCMKDSRKPKSQ